MKWKKLLRQVPDLLKGSAKDVIDAQELVRKYSIEELSETAEEYFARITNPWYHTVKPFASPEEAPGNLGAFATLVAAAELKKNHVVLDFAAGSCWTSRYLAQMGCEVVASDISPSALDIGRRALAALPLLPPHGRLDFLNFDGFTIALPDESVDRVLCLDAFHHVVNQGDVLKEINRVMKPGSIFAMSEPGPNHSRSAQSQFEMRNYKVVEQDIVVDDIVTLASAAGLSDCQVAIYNAQPHFVGAADFELTLTRGDREIADATRRFLENHRLIKMRKPGDELIDSRSRAHLNTTITATAEGSRVSVVAHNTGAAVWLPSGDAPGAVNLGIHAISRDGSVHDLDFHRVYCVEAPVAPGDAVNCTFDLPPLPAGINTVEIDLVAEHVSWFANVGTSPVRLQIND